MASNVDVKITADVVDLQAKFAVAKAESSALTAELNKLARQAAASGGTMSSELKASLTQAAEAAVRAKAEVAELNSQLKTTSSGGGSMVGMLGSLKGGLAALGITATIGAVVGFARSIAGATAEIQHESEVLGLSVTAYQDFTNAALVSGVSTDTADTAIRKFVDNLGKAAAGSKEQALAMYELGISTQQAAQDALPKVAAALLNMADKNEKARLEIVMFGRSGEELNPMLAQMASGLDAMTTKYKALGLMIDPGVTEAQEKANIELALSVKQFEVWASGPIAAATSALAHYIDFVKEYYGWMLNILSLGSIKLPAAPAQPAAQAAPPPMPVSKQPLPEKELLATLATLDPKIQERTELTKELALAQEALNAATKAHDTSGIKEADEAIRDLGKQLKELNNIPLTADQKAANKSAAELKRQAAEQEKELERQISEEATALEKNQTETDVELAKIALSEKKDILNQEYAAHQITAQQKYDATVKALNDEAAAEKAALQQDMSDQNTGIVQFVEDQNKMVVIDAQTNAARAEASRELTAELKEEDNKRLESWRSVSTEIERTESELVSDIFTKRQNLGTDLKQIGGRMLEEEVQNDLQALTEHEMVNLGILASDKATAQEGLLFKLLSYAADKAGLITAETAKIAVQSTSAAAGKAAEAAQNATSAESNSAVAATGAAASVAPVPVVGPELALAAATSTFASLQPYVAMASAATGTNFVPRDMPANIHAGERIMPAADNKALMNALGARGDLSGGDVHLHYAPVINAPQQKSLGRMLDDESGTMRAWFQSQMRDGYIRV